MYTMPTVIREALQQGATLSVSVSGGKDSQAMLRLARSWELPNRLEVVHADLGRAEWPQTPQHVEEICEGLDLTVVRRAGGDLVQRIEQRLKSVSTIDPTKPAKPFWPSAAQRYCTSDMKRGPIHKHQRALGRNDLIVSLVGMRAEESRTRAKKSPVTVEKKITAADLRNLKPDEALRRWILKKKRETSWSPAGRLVLTWLPLHEWPIGDVWHWLESSTEEVAVRQELYRKGDVEAALAGWIAHPAYVFGNERLSCALCILGSINDLCNGRKHHPELFRQYVDLEDVSGYTFKEGLSLKDLPNEEEAALQKTLF